MKIREIEVIDILHHGQILGICFCFCCFCFLGFFACQIFWMSLPPPTFKTCMSQILELFFFLNLSNRIKSMSSNNAPVAFLWSTDAIFQLNNKTCVLKRSRTLLPGANVHLFARFIMMCICLQRNYLNDSYFGTFSYIC